MGSACCPIDCLEIRRCALRIVSDRPMLIRSQGCDKLATIEENLIMAFIPLGTSDETRLAIVLNRAIQACWVVIP
jgi:hypothetical protein